MKQEFIVNYNMHIGGDCVTRQTINITAKTWCKLRDALQCQQAANEFEVSAHGYDNIDYYKQLYIATPIDHKGSMVFFNLTQRDFFNKRIKHYLKKPLLDRNTCFCIIDA